jgi:MFS family permease
MKPVALLVAGLPLVVAAGFVISPLLKMTAAVLFSASVATLAIAVHTCARKTDAPPARILLQLAAISVFAGMVLSTAYAVADFLGSNALPIPQMARTHGILNAMGFCLFGLLGWLIAGSAHREQYPYPSRHDRGSQFSDGGFAGTCTLTEPKRDFAGSSPADSNDAGKNSIETAHRSYSGLGEQRHEASRPRVPAG